jgi:hypothetical protein
MGLTSPPFHAQGIISSFSNKATPMDAERINQISNLLSDLKARTLDLRGYL